MNRGLPAGDEAGRVHWGENGGGVLNALLENLNSVLRPLKVLRTHVIPFDSHSIVYGYT